MADPQTATIRTDPAPGGDQPRRPARWRAAAALAAIVAVYALVNVLYSFSTHWPEPPESLVRVLESESTSGKALIEVVPTGTVAGEEVLKVQLTLVPPSQLVDDGALTQDVVVHLVDQGRDITFTKGSRSLTKDVPLVSSSSVENYPLDRIELDLIAHTTTKGPEGEEELPTEMAAWGKFPGWRVVTATSGTDAVDPQAAAEVASYGGTAAAVPIDVRRNGSTIAIVAVVMMTMVVLASLAAAVARSVWLRRRRIEAGLAGWLAALLFAMIPLRMNLPGAPPVGVWMDFLLFLWVLIALMLSLAVFVTAWLRYSPPPAEAAPAAAAQLPSTTTPPGA